MKRCQCQRAFRNYEIGDCDNSCSKQQREQARRGPAGSLRVVAQPTWQRMCQDPSQPAEPPRHSRPRLSILPRFSLPPLKFCYGTSPTPAEKSVPVVQWRKGHFPSCCTSPFIVYTVVRAPPTIRREYPTGTGRPPEGTRDGCATEFIRRKLGNRLLALGVGLVRGGRAMLSFDSGVPAISACGQRGGQPGRGLHSARQLHAAAFGETRRSSGGLRYQVLPYGLACRVRSIVNAELGLSLF
jgi:hypothetical protein